MITKTVKDIFKLVGSPFVLDDTITYPVIGESDANFLTYYDDRKEEMDRFFVHEYGKRLVDLGVDDEEDIAEEWEDECKSIVTIYLENWARLWYALQEPYNPLYNVDAYESTTYGQHETTMAKQAVSTTYGEQQTTYGQEQDTYQKGQVQTTYGQRQHTEGAKKTTQGSRTDTDTNYSVSYDSGTEKETGKTQSVGGSYDIDEASYINSDASYTDSVGQHTDTTTLGQHIDTQAQHVDTVGAHTDTDTSKEHTDVSIRHGNIGITKSTDLLRDEIRLRNEFQFFKTVFQTIIEEIGGYYDYPVI